MALRVLPLLVCATLLLPGCGRLDNPQPPADSPPPSIDPAPEPTPPEPEPEPEPVPPPQPLPTIDTERVLELVNAARATPTDCGAAGMRPATHSLTLNATLGLAAQKHSEDMQAAGVMSHTTPQGAIHYAPGTRFFERIGQEGYRYRSASENIAWGFSSPQAVVNAWLNSPGHCANIMSSTVTELGVGRAGNFWTQKFARPR